ncbi:MAG: hypothetical protein J6U05_05255 [Neisseriaceae bacterium]|nr:hypothetical protein [Neisseriaceae bacterium]
MIVSGSLKAILSKKQHSVGWVFNPPNNATTVIASLARQGVAIPLLMS